MSWDDLLLAISPQRGFDNADLRRVIDAITTAQQEGHITDEDAEELLKVLLATVVSGRVNAMVGDFSRLTPVGIWVLALANASSPRTVVAFR